MVVGKNTKEKPAVKSEKKRKHSVERILKKREPQIVENTKKALIFKGHATSQLICDLLTDIACLTKPHCKSLNRKNEILPFEDANSIEFLAGKADASLFAMGSHTKKRPHNLILGRLFDGHVLDMFEFGVEQYAKIGSIAPHSKALGSKPMFVFMGEQWDNDATYIRLQNLLTDFFRGEKLEMVSLKGLDHVMGWTVAEDGKIYCRVYTVGFAKSGTKVPTVELEGMGPFMDLTVRRTQLAAPDMWNLACKQPKNPNVVKKVKNISKNIMGDKVGKIHVPRQTFDNVNKGKKMKSLRN